MMEIQPDGALNIVTWQALIYIDLHTKVLNLLESKGMVLRTQEGLSYGLRHQ